MCLCVHLLVTLLSLSVFLFVCLYVCLSVSVSLSLCLSLALSLSRSVDRSASMTLSLCIIIYLLILSISISFSLLISFLACLPSLEISTSLFSLSQILSPTKNSPCSILPPPHLSHTVTHTHIHFTIRIPHHTLANKQSLKPTVIRTGQLTMS